MSAPIKAKFVRKRNTAVVARDLLGRVLVRRHAGGRVTRHIITETEAYHGETDLACHASKGRTARTDVMYHNGGVWYVYLCYGVHEMLNLVTGPAGFPAAVLIRGLADVSGPGRLTRALGIGRGLNGRSALDDADGLWLEERPAGAPRVLKKWIQATPRIGVAYAGAEWAGRPWRFVLRMPEA